MSDSNHEVAAAQENLRVIRGLMERATVYRAISSPVGLVGGSIAVIVAAWMRWKMVHQAGSVTAEWFLCVWFSALAAVIALNSWLIFRGARVRNQPFISAGMKVGLLAFVPALLAGGVIGSLLVYYENDLLICSTMWLTFYGLALLATGGFAPQSIRRLGAGFLAFGLIAFFMVMKQRPTSINDANLLAANLMGAGFGVLHIAYGASVALHSRPRREDA